jgi:flagellar motor component MotA
MPEPVWAVIGVVVCLCCVVVGYWILESAKDSGGCLLTMCVLLVVMVSGLLYFTVRFVRWAWETPMPFAK